MYPCANGAVVRFAFYWKVLRRSTHHHAGERREPEGPLLLPGLPLHRAAERDHLHLLPALHHPPVRAQHLQRFQGKRWPRAILKQPVSEWRGLINKPPNTTTLCPDRSAAMQQGEEECGDHGGPGEHHWAVGSHRGHQGEDGYPYVAHFSSYLCQLLLACNKIGGI